jgi:endo-1,4-beta-xylanase
MTLSRRTVLGALAAVSTVRTAQAKPIVDLGAIGHEHGLMFGSAFDREIFRDGTYRALISTNCRIGSIENSLKFDWLRPKGPVADFTIADRLVAFATDTKMAVRGTGLIWNDWAPGWLKSLSASEVAAMLDRHVDETVSRYAGRMQGWDVVNEPFYPPHHKQDGYRKGPWLDAMGKDYIARAFRGAAAADPNARLVLNEAFCEQDDELGRSVRPSLLALVTELKHAGVKLDAVGFQAHLKPHLPFDDQAFAAYLDRIAATGVDIYITEFDVDDSSLPDDVAVRDRMVAERCGKFLEAILVVPRVKALICWHLSDRYSWYKSADWYAKAVSGFGGDPARPVRTHLADSALRPKPAWLSVARAMETRARA